MIADASIHSTGGNAEHYHEPTAPRGERAYSVSASMLREFYRCPARWRKGYSMPKATGMSFGNLVDCLTLTPELFEHRYAIRPDTYNATVLSCPSCGSRAEAKECRNCKVPREETVIAKGWNANSEACKAWLAEREGLEIIGAEEHAEAMAAVNSIFADEILSLFIRESQKQVWVEGEWRDEETGLVIPIRALLDLVPDKDGVFCKSLGDLKTTTTAALEPFQRSVFKYGYHVQAAFHMDLYCAATGEERLNWCWLLLENYLPFQTGRRLCAESFLEIGRTTYRRALSLYCKCLQTGQWPDYDRTDETDAQGWSIVAPSPWMETEGLFSPKFEIEPAAPEPVNLEEIIP
jgi:hypothetical protein